MQEVRVKVFVDGEERVDSTGRGVIGMVYFDAEETETEMTINSRSLVIGRLGAMDVMALLEGLDKSFSEEDRNTFFDGLEAFLMMKMKGAFSNGD